MSREPSTLLEAVQYFSDAENSRDYIVSRRWPNGVTCPVCGAAVSCYLANVGRYQCSKRHPKRQFTVKTGTVMEDSPLPLEKWLLATWLVCNAKSGISTYEIARAMGVTQKTAWFMLHRIRCSLQGEQVGKLVDHVEVDETYIGGKAPNMHRHVREARIKGRDSVGKAIVMAMLERGGKVVTKHIEATDGPTLQGLLRTHVDKGWPVLTDGRRAYRGLSVEYRHSVVDHAVAYIEGQIRTNGLENLWSLLKGTIGGTYVSIGASRLHRYLDEQAFRRNNRKGSAARLSSAVEGIARQRLTSKQLPGWVSF